MGEEPRSKRHWSNGERVVAIVLISILVVSVTAFGVMVYASTYGLCGAFGPRPCPGMVVLTIESHTLNSPTNVTLNIRNSGSAAVTLISYYVKNASGQVYANSNWSGPALPANAITPVSILIDGRAFTFQPRYTYNVIVVAPSGQFGFTIEA
jgi:hypothetical protein